MEKQCGLRNYLGTITTKRIKSFNTGLFKRFNKTKKVTLLAYIYQLSISFGFYQDINRVLEAVHVKYY